MHNNKEFYIKAQILSINKILISIDYLKIVHLKEVLNPISIQTLI